LKTLETFRACYRAGIKANRYIRANRDGTIQFLIDWMKLNRGTAVVIDRKGNKWIWD
jgi:hypothetical protein